MLRPSIEQQIPDADLCSGVRERPWLTWRNAFRGGVVEDRFHLLNLASTVGVSKQWRYLHIVPVAGEHASGCSVELVGTLSLGLAVLVGLGRHQFVRLVAPAGAPDAPRERLGYLGDSFLAHRSELVQPYPAVEIALDWLDFGVIDDRYELRPIDGRRTDY